MKRLALVVFCLICTTAVAGASSPKSTCPEVYEVFNWYVGKSVPACKGKAEMVWGGFKCGGKTIPIPDADPACNSEPDVMDACRSLAAKVPSNIAFSEKECRAVWRFKVIESLMKGEAR